MEHSSIAASELCLSQTNTSNQEKWFGYEILKAKASNCAEQQVGALRTSKGGESVCCEGEEDNVWLMVGCWDAFCVGSWVCSAYCSLYSVTDTFIVGIVQCCWCFGCIRGSKAFYPLWL